MSFTRKVVTKLTLPELDKAVASRAALTITVMEKGVEGTESTVTITFFGAIKEGYVNRNPTIVSYVGVTNSGVRVELARDNREWEVEFGVGDEVLSFYRMEEIPPVLAFAEPHSS